MRERHVTQNMFLREAFGEQGGEFLSCVWIVIDDMVRTRSLRG
jgi:hypothetical protein